MKIPTKPFGSIPRPNNDVSTSREVAFSKIRARVSGTKLAEALISGRSHGK